MTLVSDRAMSAPRNALHTVAAAGGVALGLFLFAAAYGHFAAVWPALENAASTSGKRRFVLLLPGLVLALTALVNIAVCRALWLGTPWARRVALGCNLVAALYLTYLLNQGVPNHPIGFFTTLLWCYVIVLGAIQAGLVWPTIGRN